MNSEPSIPQMALNGSTMKTTKKHPTQKTFRVWIEQVNQACVDVTAHGQAEAHTKAYRKWRREYAHARISEVQQISVP